MNAGKVDKPCGLISIIPAHLHGEWAGKFDALIESFRPAALILSPPFDHAAAILTKAQSVDLAVLLADDIEKARELNIPGAYLTGGAQLVSRARSTLGAGAVIGAACDLTRHDAMEKAEAGADFIVFEVAHPEELAKALELAAWWDEVAEVACALGSDPALHDRGSFHTAGFDFLVVTESAKAGSSLTFATEFGLIDAV